MPREERAEAPIEKRSADGLDIGEVKAHAAGGFQRFGDLGVDLLRVDTRTHPTAIVAQVLEEAKAFRRAKANDEHPPTGGRKAK